MDKGLLNLTPTQYLCPYCGEWHNWYLPNKLGYYDVLDPAVLECDRQLPLCRYRETHIYFSNGYCYYKTVPTCSPGNLDINSQIPIEDIVESSEEPRVTFAVSFTTDGDVGKKGDCQDCCSRNICLMCKLGDENNSRHMHITFGFEFEQSDYEKFSKAFFLKRKERELQERKDVLSQKELELQELEQSIQPKVKEGTSMAETTKKKTSIKSILYENSPKENFETLKAWAEKYKPVLKWAVPVAAVYGAYRILNSGEFDLSVNNIAETCEKQFGFKLSFLENKRALKELMVIGGLSAGAYGAVKAASCIFGAKEEKDISVEEVEAGMNQLESISKKFAWIQPKTEDMLPIAFSVILVYVTLHKPKFTGKTGNKLRAITEDFRIKIDTYIDLIKLFVQDKFNINLSNEEEQKKLKICAFLIALSGVFVFLYGKKVLGNKEASEESEHDKDELSKSAVSFVEQAKVIIEKIAPTVYTSLITMMVSKKLLMLNEVSEVLEVNEDDESPSDEDDTDISTE